MKMKCSVEVGNTARTEPLTVQEIGEWAASVPAEARPTAPILMMRDIGNQRDSYRILVGLRAEWEEER